MKAVTTTSKYSYKLIPTLEFRLSVCWKLVLTKVELLNKLGEKYFTRGVIKRTTLTVDTLSLDSLLTIFVVFLNIAFIFGNSKKKKKFHDYDLFHKIMTFHDPQMFITKK